MAVYPSRSCQTASRQPLHGTNVRRFGTPWFIRSGRYSWVSGRGSDTRVRSSARTPVYQAAIHVLVRWGVAHKTDLTVSTNYYGKAEFTGLPNYSKKAIQFDVKSGDKQGIVFFDPGNQCHAKFTVELR